MSELIYKRLNQLTIHQCRDEILRLESVHADLKSKYQIAVSALKFYGDRPEDEETHMQLDWSLVNNSAAIQDKGKHARLCLAELGEK